MRGISALLGASAAIALATPALAQDNSPRRAEATEPQSATAPTQAETVDAGNVAAGPEVDPTTEDIVVTGQRVALERAAEIKRAAVQVVDAIVASDIGKFPDPTTAAALQRVPGVQVQNNANNELSGVRIRGLTDILTTVDGREVFTTTGRGFELVDLPAEALARVDVYKSQTADLIEGGVAGGIDLKLNKPFNFRKPTFVGTARVNYGDRVGKSGPLLGLLATSRADTGIGEVGALINATYSRAPSSRSQSNMTDRRSSGAAPLNTPGFLIPQVIQNMPDVGVVTRKQINAALQWQATPSLEAYADGLYTWFRTTAGFAGFNPQPFTLGTTVSNIVADDNCFDARVTANGTNPNIVTAADGTRSLQPFTVQRVCNIRSAQFNNIVINQNSSSIQFTQRNKLIAGGLRFDQDRTKANLDVGYQTSDSFRENVNAEVGQRVPTLLLETDYKDGQRTTVGAQYPLSDANLSLRNAFNQNFTRNDGSLFQAKTDGEYEVGGLLRKVQVGLRYAARVARQRDIQLTTPVPFGNIGTATEARARLVSSLPLSPDFLGVIGFAPRLNGGTDFLGVNPAYLRSERGRNELRALFGLPQRQPDYEPTRQFDATERTYSSYVQGDYEVPIGGMTLDGTAGVRVTRTDRTISTFRRVSGQVVPVEASTSDVDILPSATARLQVAPGFQTRLTYSRAIRRPEFEALNPTLSLVFVGNVFLINSASAGNPDLKPQQSDSFDATAEYYFDNGFLAATLYYRNIKDRVVTAATQETINGENFLTSRPRNVGQAELKGLEVSGQYFFDFLPGALSGLGALGAFTYADSVIKGTDLLSGLPLQGVSKYNYTAGLLYDKERLSARVVYTYRSRYYNGDVTGSVQLRPFDADTLLPTALNYVRPAGRLDFSIAYDVTEAFRIDVGGVNILRNQTKQYFGQPFIASQVFGDETTYTIGARVRF